MAVISEFSNLSVKNNWLLREISINLKVIDFTFGKFYGRYQSTITIISNSAHFSSVNWRTERIIIESSAPLINRINLGNEVN